MTPEQRKRIIQSLDERIPLTRKDGLDRAMLYSIRLWLSVGLTPSDIHKLHRGWLQVRSEAAKSPPDPP